MLIFGGSPPAGAVSTIHSRWDHQALTYGFENGTSDIAGDGEEQAVRQAMGLWSAASPVTFHQVNVANAEIRIKWATGVHGDELPFGPPELGGAYAHAFFPAQPLDGDVHFNDGWTFTMSSRSEEAQPIDLVTVAGHELGHSLGVMHSFAWNLVTSVPYRGSMRFLGPDDLDSIHSLYGDHPGRRFFLRNSLSEGLPSVTFLYGNAGQRPIAGDWNADGIDTPGYYRKDNRVFYLRNSNTSGLPDISFAYGQYDDLPVAGDWNGDGLDSVGVYRPSNGTFYLTNNLTNGNGQYTVSFANPGDLPVVGDWNGDGVDTVGVYRPSNGTFYLTDTNASGPPDYVFAYGNPGDVPVAGDWQGTGRDRIGLFRPGNGFWYVEQDVLATSSPEWVFPYGPAGPRIPLVGDWDNDGTDTPAVVFD